MASAESSRGHGDDAKAEEPIFSLAWDCDNLIQECVGKAEGDGSPTKGLLEDCERRFNAWWEYLGVFAGRKANLDRRLHHQPEIRDIVVRLLLILRRNLTQLKECQGSLSSGVPSQPTHPVAPRSATLEDGIDIDDLSSLMTLSLEAIDESLVELSQVGIAIRQSSRTTETVRARRFASAQLDLSSFEALAFLALETLYPNAPESLLVQLGKSMVDRYACLLFRAPRRDILKRDIRQQAPDPTLVPPITRLNVEDPQPAQNNGVKGQSVNLAERQHHAPPTIALSSVNWNWFQDKLRIAQSARSRSGTTVILAKTHEPPIPRFDDSGEVQCRWCFTNISQNLVKDGCWSTLGREHYRKDLEPFSCISEDCAEAVPTFSSIKSWREHMLRHHSSWTQCIHRQPMWRCNLECMHESETLFPTPDHLRGHIRALHKGIWSSLDDASFAVLAKESVSDVLRMPNTCPLCCLTPNGMESLDYSSEEIIPVPRAMENHIAEHLQNLMVLSLRLIETQNEEPDGDSKGGSMTPNESSQGSRIDHSEANSDSDELPSPPLGSPTVRPESLALNDGEPPETDAQDWSIVAEGTRRQHPELDGDSDSILAHLRTQQETSLKAERRYKLPETSTLPSALSAAQMVPLLQPWPCDACEEQKSKAFYCVHCDVHFCDQCWDKQLSHEPGRVGRDGLPHEKADPLVVNRLKETFTPPDNPKIREKMHIKDEDTTWFGITRDATNMPIFEDYGRYARLMANSTSGEFVRYPQLVSFIGQTGAGKSALVKMLIEQQRIRCDPTTIHLFPTPIVGSVYDIAVTSADVHLYADPGTYLGSLPMLYADCEGFDGGERVPIGVRHRELESGNLRKRAEPQTDAERSRVKEQWEMASGSQGDITRANSSETRKREFAATELYQRLLYTFSDVIVYVLRNTRTFETIVLSKLLDLASSSMENSLNQPILPHLIIALNATNNQIDAREWDIDFATNLLLTEVAGAINQDIKCKAYTDYWTSRGKVIHTTKDLLECYYSSVTVVRIPIEGRYMLINEQVSKLHQAISLSCKRSLHVKQSIRMLYNSDELHVYLQLAFDHFSQKLNSPFLRNFHGNILNLAAVVQKADICDGGPEIFRELSNMVASYIVLDCDRQNLKGTYELLLEKYYIEYCGYALDDFCDSFWPCEYSTREGRCVNVKRSHTKGHQNEKGSIIGLGSYVASFTPTSFGNEWLKLLQVNVQSIQDNINTQLLQDGLWTGSKVISEIHRQNLQKFYWRLGGGEKPYSVTTCFCCLQENPEHPLPCGHTLCWPCVTAYGSSKRDDSIQLDACPLHSTAPFQNPIYIKRANSSPSIKPPYPEDLGDVNASFFRRIASPERSRLRASQLLETSSSPSLTSSSRATSRSIVSRLAKVFKRPANETGIRAETEEDKEISDGAID